MGDPWDCCLLGSSLSSLRALVLRFSSLAACTFSGAGNLPGMRFVLRSLHPLRRAWRVLLWFVDWGGNRAAASLTYYLFLVLLPVLLLAASVTALVLRADLSLRERLFVELEALFPGQDSRQLVAATLDQAGTFGLLAGLAILALGLGVLDSLREGVKQVWGLPQGGDPLLQRKFRDLLWMLVLAPLVLASLLLSASALRLASRVLELLSVDDFDGAVLRSVSVLLGASLTFGVLLAVFTGVVGRPAPRRALFAGALVGALLVELFKFLFVLYLDVLPAGGLLYGSLSGVFGVLVWLNLVSRVVFFAAAWARTSPAFVAASPLPPRPSA